MMMMVRVTELLLSLDTYIHAPTNVYMYTLPVNLHALLSPSAVTVHIEETAYQVSEDEGSIEVCAVIQSPHPTECPVNFGISVRFTTTNEDAGTCVT